MRVYLKKKSNLSRLWDQYRLLFYIENDVYLPWGGKLPKVSSIRLCRPSLVRINKKINEILMIQSISDVKISNDIIENIQESLKLEIIKLFGEKYNIKIIINDE